MRKQELNPAKLANLFRDEFRLCNVRSGETVVLLSDLETRREFVAAAFAAADELGADIFEMCVNAIPSWTKVGVPTIGKCKGTLDAIMAADMLVCFHIPLFTRWLKDVRDAGTQVLMVIDAPDDLHQLMAPPGLKDAVVHAGRRLEQAKTMRVTSAAGTDLTVALGEYPTMIQYGFAESPGRFDHWGAGHVHTFPNEGTANGTVVIDRGDLVILPYNRYVQDEIRLEVRDGFITKIAGGLDAKLMSTWLDDNRRDAEDRDGYAISHLGWGLNPQARWDALALHGDDPERTFASARTFPGNFLFSTGPNTQGGGNRTTLAHYDVPMRDCTVMLDGEPVIERGKIVDPKMIVAPVAR
jgi:2,5-dihydroxypyridine 5,6-dioxygenase